MTYTIDELKQIDKKNVSLEQIEGYINGGRELVRIKQDRFDKRRFVIWNETQQRQITVRSTKTAAVSAFLSLF